jgi:hypothetical protein
MEETASSTRRLSQEYLTVIYGLVTTEGLREFVLSGHHAELAFSIRLLLFGGTFLQALHFWMSAVTADKSATDLYALLAQTMPRRRLMFLLTDMLFATAIAGCILTMFLNLDHNDRTFFHFFLILAIVSLGYDLFAFLVSAVTEIVRRHVAKPEEKEKRSKYLRLVAMWLLQDSYCVVGSGFVYLLLYQRFWTRFPVRVSGAYAALVALFFLLDVVALHWRTYRDGLLT